jgi:hypothetical protein
MSVTSIFWLYDLILVAILTTLLVIYAAFRLWTEFMERRLSKVIDSKLKRSEIIGKRSDRKERIDHLTDSLAEVRASVSRDTGIRPADSVEAEATMGPTTRARLSAIEESLKKIDVSIHAFDENSQSHRGEVNVIKTYLSGIDISINATLELLDDMSERIDKLEKEQIKFDKVTMVPAEAVMDLMIDPESINKPETDASEPVKPIELLPDPNLSEIIDKVNSTTED